MATTKYRHASDRTVGTNSASLVKPPGQPPQKYLNGGENLTPAPTKPVVESSAEQAIRRSTSWGRASGEAGDNPGKNGSGSASSLMPGERSGVATVAPQAPTDTVLSDLIRGGVKALDANDSWQTRSPAYADAKSLAPAMGMAKPSSSGVVPSKNGWNPSAPVRQPK